MKILKTRKSNSSRNTMIVLGSVLSVCMLFSGCGKNQSENQTSPTQSPAVAATPSPTPMPTATPYWDTETEIVNEILKEFKDRGFTAADFMIANLDEDELPDFIRWLWRVNNGYSISIDNSSYYSEIIKANMAFNGLLSSILIKPASDYRSGKWTGKYKTFPMSMFYQSGSAKGLAKQMDEAIYNTLNGSEKAVKENATLILKEVGDHYDLKGFPAGNIDRVAINYIMPRSNVTSLLIYYQMGVSFVGNINTKITYQYPEEICDGEKVTVRDMAKSLLEDCDPEKSSGLYSNAIAGAEEEIRSYVADHPEIDVFVLTLD